MNNLIERTQAAAFDALVPVTTNGSGQTIDSLMTTVVGWISLIVSIMAFIYLIYSGILYITAAGNPDQAKKGQQGIINAIIGIVICVFAYTIVSVIAKRAATGV